MKHNFIREYKNIRIRAVNESDLELLRKWRNNKKNTKFLSKIPFITKEMQQNWYRKMELQEDEYVFAIDEIIELKRCVGSFSLYNFSDNKVEFGRILIGDDMAHGKKVAVNSMIASINLSFQIFDVEKVILHVYKANEIAIKVYEQVGFLIKEQYNTENGIELLMEITKKNFYDKGDYHE